MIGFLPVEPISHHGASMPRAQILEEDSTELVGVPAIDPYQLTREFRDLQQRSTQERPDRLVQIDGPGAPREFPLNSLPHRMGRDPHAEIPVRSVHVSHHHLHIKRDGYDIVVSDMESRNGSWLNNTRVHEASLRDGDTLQVGDAIFVYHRGS